MKKQIIPTLAMLMLALSAFVFVTATAWKIGDAYAIKFDSKDASGIFSKFGGQILFDEADLAASKFQVTIDVNSINTGNGMKNRHAKSEKWFDADKYPQIAFTSTEIRKTATGYAATGTLMLHGISKPTTIPFTFENAGGTGVFKSAFPINRVDFGVGEAGGKVPDVINLDIMVPVTKN